MVRRWCESAVAATGEKRLCRLRQIAWVKRRGIGRALPRSHLQADFDIVTLPGSSPSETLLADAEAIRAVSEVSKELLTYIINGLACALPA